MMPSLRLVTWNCNHGTLNQRLTLLQPLRADIVFLQECRPSPGLPLYGEFFTFSVNEKKAIALGSPSERYQLSQLDHREGCGTAILAARCTTPVSFAVLGIWSHEGPDADYVEDVIRSLSAYEEVVRSIPTVVMGDLNSGPKIARPSEVSKSHGRMLSAFSKIGMVSAYHAFHKVEHGEERHHTYRHKPLRSEPWHIDFCFVPQQWAGNLTHVEVLDGEVWRAESDHHPLLVDLKF